MPGLEGFILDDLAVASKFNCPGAASVTFNAYQSILVNLQKPWPYGPALPRAGPAPGAPRVDLNILTLPTRGDLYVCDVFRNDTAFGGPPYIAAHDFRLAPNARVDSVSILNPLVNRGIDISTVSPGTIVMRNGTMFAAPPGNLPDGPARFDAWDWDGEGFGNPRIAVRRASWGQNPPMFPVPLPCAGTIDLGADELGELIVSGYVDSTRIFSRPHAGVAANTAGIGPRASLYFFNVYAQGNLFVRPQCNVMIDLARTPLPPGGQSEWYAQITPNTNPYNTIGTSNYTTGVTDLVTTRELLTTVPVMMGVPTLPLFMRNLQCDISPHLMFDTVPTVSASARQVNYAEHGFFHPSTGGAPILDQFDANPWYHTAAPPANPLANDNLLLYPLPGSPIQSGTIHPPATTMNDPSPSVPPASYLFRNAVHPIILWDFTLAQTFLYSVGPRGWGIPPGGETVPFIPTMDWQGIRVNLELFAPGDPAWASYGNPVNNIQTFLIVQGLGVDVPPLLLEQQSTASRMPAAELQCGPGTARHGEVRRLMERLSSK